MSYGWFNWSKKADHRSGQVASKQQMDKAKAEKRKPP